MKLNNQRRAGGILLAVMIVQLAYYGILILKEIHKRRHPSGAVTTEYYNPAASLIAGQCGPGGCRVSSGPSYSPADDGESWMMPSLPSDGWVYKRGGVVMGQINRDGTTTGFVSAQPSWYPTGMPQAFQRVGQAPQQRTNVGELPPAGQPYAGQGPLPPTGVDPGKVAEDKAKIPGGISINGSPQTEALVRDRLSDSAKAQGLKDYENALRLVVVGHNDNERKAFVSIAKPMADASDGKLIIQEYDDGDWQIKAHANAAKSVPDYEQGKPFAYLQRSTGAVKAIMFTPSEVAQVIKQARPEVAPNFDAVRARALTQSSNDWLWWASGGFIALMGLIGAITSKPQQ